MKYKCIGNLEKDGRRIMKEGDIVIIRGDELYNISTGVDYKGITYDEAVGNLVAVTDEVPYRPTDCMIDFKEFPYNPPTSDAERFEQITDKMIDTFKKKNHDYGNSFEQSLNEEGIVAARVRLADKWNRFKQLSKGTKALVNDESLRDTMLDMANYLIMTIMWMDKYDNVQEV